MISDIKKFKIEDCRPGFLGHWIFYMIGALNDVKEFKKEKINVCFDNENFTIIQKQTFEILKNRIISQGNQIKLNLKYYDNKGLIHQRKDCQCGMYTLYFIAELLQEKKEPEFFRDQRVPDELMRDYRIKYYNTE